MILFPTAARAAVSKGSSSFDRAIILYNNRHVCCFLLVQLVPAVTELMVAELMYLEKQGQSLPIEMLINSSGTTRQDGEIVSGSGGGGGVVLGAA